MVQIQAGGTVSLGHVERESWKSGKAGQNTAQIDEHKNEGGFDRQMVETKVRHYSRNCQTAD